MVDGVISNRYFAIKNGRLIKLKILEIWINFWQSEVHNGLNSSLKKQIK